MALKVGDKAPGFTLMDGQREKWSLESYRGQKNVVIAFYSLAFTSGWEKELGAFRDAYEEFQKANTEVLGISIDPWPTAGVFAKTLRLAFPMLSDWPQNEVIKAYDVWNPERYAARRTTFVVDKEGIIRGVIESETDMIIHSRDSLRIVQELEGART